MVDRLAAAAGQLPEYPRDPLEPAGLGREPPEPGSDAVIGANGAQGPCRKGAGERLNDSPGAADDHRLDGATRVSGGLSSEARLFGRMAIFGIGVGALYWFLTYEPAGSVILTTFGVASGIAAIAIFVGSRQQPPIERPAAD